MLQVAAESMSALLGLRRTALPPGVTMKPAAIPMEER
jgi:hypothetical protein